MKSPLRYPGGKTRAIKILEKYIPEGTKEICSPFFGGGSFELFLEDKGIKVYAYDNFEPLVSFWQYLRNDRFLLHSNVERFYPMTKDNFNYIQKNIMDMSNVRMAAMFYAINRSSFSGSTFSGGMSPNTPRFNKRSLDYLLSFKTDINVKYFPFELSIDQHDCLVFADPPYYIENNLYGNKGDMHKYFNHKLLSIILLKRGNFILTYNDCKYIRELYKDCNIEIAEWSYGMNKSKKSSEIIITPKNG